MMLPALATSPQIDEITLLYTKTLAQAGFEGDIANDYASRLTMATDNSIYQLIPQSVLFPRTTNDVSLIARLAQQAKFHALRFVPRGGGTGTNGQALNLAIVVDLSRYMTQILSLDLAKGVVHVEAGVVKDQLNDYLKPHGYFFAPELSTSNRATLGGMISTDASGQGSLVYGKTSDYVLALTAVLINGEIVETASIPLCDAKIIATQETAIGTIYNTVIDSVTSHRDLILQTFPALTRFLTGYDLKHVISADGTAINLSRLLAGSEGTLAFVTEATLAITKLPAIRYLINIQYDSFNSALRHANTLLAARVLSIETIDSTVLDLARQDIIWSSVSGLIPTVLGKTMAGINIIEFAGDDEALLLLQVSALLAQLDALISAEHAGIIGYHCCDKLDEIDKIYAMRKKAVGLLGRTKGAAKPIPFVEDTVVPPEKLADYILEFRAILDSHQLTYGMFGHVDVGVLHVRPALDMCSPDQEKLMHHISDKVAQLTHRYGGLLWGEHGKGVRSAYGTLFFDPVIYTQLRRIKGAFDPYNRLNPGKICSPIACDEPLFTIQTTTRGAYDRSISSALRETFSGAMACNGNGLCFNYDHNSFMCPSMKVRRDRVHSPKGRAALIREWLRLLCENGITPAALNSLLDEKRPVLRSLVRRATLTWRAMQGEYDFSHEVNRSMQGCLACKACATQCPIKIDVPAFRAQFFTLYYSRYLRPPRDHLIANVEQLLPIMAQTPRLFNALFRLRVMKWISQRVGVVDLPLLSIPTLKMQLATHQETNTALSSLEALSLQARQEYVFIVQDSFTSYYDANVVSAVVLLIKQLGLKPVVLPFFPNGKSQHVKGFLARFADTASKMAQQLSRAARLGIPLIGIDPAITLSYRDEYPAVLGEVSCDFQVHLIQEWLYTQRERLPRVLNNNQAYFLLGHCTESSLAVNSTKQWGAIFDRLGAMLHTVNVGCCGMAGIYGHEAANLTDSKALYELSWQNALKDKPIESCMATGYSCRTQVKRFDRKQLKHPIQIILSIMEEHSIWRQK